MNFFRQKDAYLKTAVVIIPLLTFAVFLPGIFCGFTNWDDQWMLLDNPLIRSLSQEGLKEMFFGKLYVMNYQPLVFLTYAVEYHFFGFEPWIYHLTNVLLHSCNALLVFFLLRSIGGRAEIAFIAALLWSLHPLRVESVVWVTTRRDVLYSFFYLLALIRYVKYMNCKLQIKNYFLCIVFFLLSCMSKGMAVSLPLALIPIDYILRRKLDKSIILDKIPFFLISLFFGYVAMSGTHDKDALAYVYEVFSLFDRINIVAYGYLTYLYKFLAPVHLSALYPYPFVYGSTDLPFYFVFLPAIAALLIFIVAFSAKYSRKIIFGIGFYTATVLFVLQFFPVYKGIIAERYTYLPYIGLSYIAAEVFFKTGYFLAGYVSWSMKLFKVLAFTLFIALSFLTIKRIDIWKNGVTLWTDVIQKYPENFIGYYSRGLAYNNNEKYNEAVADLNVAASLYPAFYDIYSQRGTSLHKLGDFESAKKDFLLAVSLNPDEPFYYVNLGAVYFDIAEYDTALACFHKALNFDPGNGQAHINISNVLAKQGDYNGAMSRIDSAIAVEPFKYQAYFTKGNLNVVMKEYSKAVLSYDKAISLHPDFKDAWFNRGGAKHTINDRNGACSDWRKAAELGKESANKLIWKYCR